MNTFILLTAGFAVLGISTCTEVYVTLTNTGVTVKGETRDGNPNRIVIKNSDRWQGDPELVELCRQIQTCIALPDSNAEIREYKNFAFLSVKYLNFPVPPIHKLVFEISVDPPVDEGQGLAMAFSFKRPTLYDPSKNRNLFFAILKSAKEYRVRCVVDEKECTMEIQKYYYPEGVWNNDDIQEIHNDVEAFRSQNRATICFAKNEAELVTAKWNIINRATKSGNPTTIKISWEL